MQKLKHFILRTGTEQNIKSSYKDSLRYVIRTKPEEDWQIIQIDRDNTRENIARGIAFGSFIPGIYYMEVEISGKYHRSEMLRENYQQILSRVLKSNTRKKWRVVVCPEEVELASGVGF